MRETRILFLIFYPTKHVVNYYYIYLQTLVDHTHCISILLPQLPTKKIIHKNGKYIFITVDLHIYYNYIYLILIF